MIVLVIRRKGGLMGKLVSSISKTSTIRQRIKPRDVRVCSLSMATTHTIHADFWSSHGNTVFMCCVTQCMVLMCIKVSMLLSLQL